jgi:hypothetical protein
MSTLEPLSFFSRFGMAFISFWQILLKPAFARALLPTYEARRQLAAGRPVSATSPAEDKPEDKPKAPAAESVAPSPAAALWLLSALQREGRLIDFLQQELTGFSDADVGAAARVIHTGCRKVLHEYFPMEPVLSEPEGAQVTVPTGFDAGRIRLTGNVAGRPPFAGALKHHGWVAQQIHFPALSATLDPRVLAPAEVELS